MKKKPVRIVKNEKGGWNLLTDINTGKGDVVEINTGDPDKSLPFWVAISNAADRAITSMIKF